MYQEDTLYEGNLKPASAPAPLPSATPEPCFAARTAVGGEMQHFSRSSSAYSSKDSRAINHGNRAEGSENGFVRQHTNCRLETNGQRNSQQQAVGGDALGDNQKYDNDRRDSERPQTLEINFHRGDRRPICKEVHGGSEMRSPHVTWMSHTNMHGNTCTPCLPTRPTAGQQRHDMHNNAQTQVSGGFKFQLSDLETRLTMSQLSPQRQVSRGIQFQQQNLQEELTMSKSSHEHTSNPKYRVENFMKATRSEHQEVTPQMAATTTAATVHTGQTTANHHKIQKERTSKLSGTTQRLCLKKDLSKSKSETCHLFSSSSKNETN